MTVKNKTAVVTGSTSGIGLGVATELAKQGCNIMLNGFGDAGEIEEIRSGLEKDYNITARYCGADLSKPDEATGLVKEAEDKFGHVDILVNNAGIQHVAPIEEFTGEKWEKIIAINLSAAFYTTAAAIPGMKQRDWGRVINIASAHGLVASAGKTGYVASKHGIIGMTKVVALENATTGITCNAICPGWVLTPLVQKQIDAIAGKKGLSIKEAEIELLSEKQPSLRFTLPEEVGAMVVYLCSDPARNITGTTLSIDGGWIAR